MIASYFVDAAIAAHDLKVSEFQKFKRNECERNESMDKLCEKYNSNNEELIENIVLAQQAIEKVRKHIRGSCNKRFYGKFMYGSTLDKLRKEAQSEWDQLVYNPESKLYFGKSIEEVEPEGNSFKFRCAYNGKSFCLRNKMESLDDLILSRYVELIKKYGVGNCGEQSELAYYHLRKRTFNVEIVRSEKHKFVVLGRKADSDINNPNSWGDSAVVCDPWMDDDYFPDEIFSKIKSCGLYDNNDKLLQQSRTCDANYMVKIKSAMGKEATNAEEIAKCTRLIDSIESKNIEQQDHELKVFLHNYLYHLKRPSHLINYGDKQSAEMKIDSYLDRRLQQIEDRFVHENSKVPTAYEIFKSTNGCSINTNRIIKKHCQCSCQPSGMNNIVE
jgi:hypothetical protein